MSNTPTHPMNKGTTANNTNTHSPGATELPSAPMKEVLKKATESDLPPEPEILHTHSSPKAEGSGEHKTVESKKLKAHAQDSPTPAAAAVPSDKEQSPSSQSRHGHKSSSPATQGHSRRAAKEAESKIGELDASYPGDLVTLLTDHHVQMRGLLNEIAATSGDTRRAAFAELQRLLAVHDTAEMILVHPESRLLLADGERVVAARLHEEEVARVVMGTLSVLDPDAPEFEATFDDFKKSLWKHMDAEESEEFPRLREALPPAQLEHLKARIGQVERIVPPLRSVDQADLLLSDQETRFDDISGTVRAVLMGGQ